MDRKFDGQYTLDKLSIISHDGTEADLLHVFSEVNLYEDVLSNSLSGSLNINDGLNLISNLPIVGGETLKMVWSTDGKEDFPIDLTMVVHRIGEKVMVSENLRNYTLFFTTPEAFTDQITQLVKYYDGSASSIVEQIYEEAFPGSDKTFEIEKTKNIHSVIPCHWTPFYTINYLSKYAISKTKNKTGFLFFEGVRGYYFKSIESMYEQEPAITYQKLLDVEVKNFSSQSYQERMTHVENHLIGETGQYLDALSMGAFGHQWLYVDIYNKKLVKHEYQYSEEFDKATHVEKYPLVPGDTTGFDNKTSARYMKYWHPYSDNGNRTESDLLLMNKRHAVMHQLGMTEVTLTVPGDSDMTVGTVVEYDMPSVEKMHNEFKRERFYSGRSLVTAIRHRLTRDKYEMILTIAKDSLSDDPSKGGE